MKDKSKVAKLIADLKIQATISYEIRVIEDCEKNLQKNFRKLKLVTKNLDIHHIDTDKTNNDISNLQLLTKSEHQRIHRLMDKKNFTGICSNCGKEFKSRNKSARFCSKECSRQTKFTHYYEERICKVCGKKFNVRKDAKSACCSVECASYSSCMKLSYDDVRYIRKNYKRGDSKLGIKALAKKFNVGVVTISRIVNGKSYKNVE